MKRLSVIADTIDTLPAVREAVGESLNYDRSIQAALDLAIDSIHPEVRKYKEPRRASGVNTGIDTIPDEAYKAAMGYARPQCPITSYWYSKAITAKVNAEIAAKDLVAILMLEDMGDGDDLYYKGTVVFAPVTFAILAIGAKRARYATEDEVDGRVELVQAGLAEPVAVVVTPERTNLRKAVTVHARCAAA